MKQIDWNDWLSKDTKHSSRISFKLVLNAEAYPYLSAYNEKELALKLLTYASQKNMKHLFEREMIKKIASKLHSIFQNKNNNVESSLKDLVAMNKYNIFQELGIGFLASLLPEDKLSELVYFKMELLALDQKTIKLDFGRLNYEMLYRELSEIQSKIGNRSYDLRVPNPIQP